MTQQPHTTTSSPTNTTASLWIVVALAGHMGWGSYPVLGRYLQVISNLPSMSILALGNTIALAVMAFLFRRRLTWAGFAHPILWFFAAIVTLRGVTNLLATRFTLAIYVQLITLMVPFVVAFLSAVFLKEKLPPFTIRALILATLGAVLMLSGSMDQLDSQLLLTPSDWLGLGLAATSALALGTYMVIVRRSTNRQIGTETILIVQLVALIAFSGVVSGLLREDWSQYTRIGPLDWLVFAAYVGGVLLMANLSQVTAIRHLGATLVGSLLPSRLVVALLMGGLLLNERLTSAWQVLGAIIVLVTLSWYLWQQRQPKSTAPPKQRN